jgi:hypothetical protein
MHVQFANELLAMLFGGSRPFAVRAPTDPALLPANEANRKGLAQQLRNQLQAVGFDPPSDDVSFIRMLQSVHEHVLLRATEAARRGEQTIYIDSFIHPEERPDSGPRFAPSGDDRTDAEIAADNYRAGAMAERVAGADVNKTRFNLRPDGTNLIPDATGKKPYRIPDIVDRIRRVIGEIKNTPYLYFSSQIRDDLAIARSQGGDYTVELRVSRKMRCSAPLRHAIAMGRIRLVYYDGPHSVTGPPRC